MTQYILTLISLTHTYYCKIHSIRVKVGKQNEWVKKIRMLEKKKEKERSKKLKIHNNWKRERMCKRIFELRLTG